VALERAGCFSIVLESIPDRVAESPSLRASHRAVATCLVLWYNVRVQ